MVFSGPLISDEFPAPNSLLASYPRSGGQKSSPRWPRKWLITSLLTTIAVSVTGSLWVMHGFSNYQSLRTDLSDPTGNRPGLPVPLIRYRAGRYEHANLITLADPRHYPLLASQWKREHFMSEFKAFQRKFRSIYSTPKEFERRFHIFKRNMIFILKHNEDTKATYQLAANQFTDLTPEEFAAQSTGFLPPPKTDALPSWKEPLFIPPEAQDVPESVDWRLKNCVTPVKDQARCGSCWAFSSTGAIEGAICAQTGKLVSLSEQQLVDCTGPEGNSGCNGGEMDLAFKYVLEEGGLCKEDDYPYLGKGDQCRSNCTKVATIVAFHDIPKKSEKAMKQAVAHYGPVAVGIEADQAAFQFYHSGVFNAKCGKSLDHAVLLTGYGTDAVSGIPYWTVKNSWGSWWGDQGYIRMALHRGKSGECGILLDGSVPIVEGEDII